MPAWEHRDVKRIFLALALCLAAVLVAATDARAESAKATVVLAGGCFWCVEHDFRQLPGVTKAVSGYSGGSRPNPTYENYHDVDAENPVPHVEVAQITYDPSKLSYAALLDYYFRHIDPTDREGQFCDRGPAYRPVIFVANEEERKVAEAKKAKVAELIKQPVAVEIADLRRSGQLRSITRPMPTRTRCATNFTAGTAGATSVSRRFGAPRKRSR
jgi:peptide-methionine (S)-S-oxide reductase